MKIDHSKQDYHKIAIKEKSKISFINICEILYLQCDGYLTTINLLNNKRIIVAKLLKHFEYELGEYGFIRSNHSTLINSRYISALKISKQRRIIIIKENEIHISRRKFYILKDFLVQKT